LGRIIRNFGWNDEEIVAPGKLEILYTSPVELSIDAVGAEMLRRIEELNVRRVVIDSLGDLERHAMDPVRFRDYVYSVIQYLAYRNITSLFTLEARIQAESDFPAGKDLLNITDNTLLLAIELKADLIRTIRVLKSRGSAHDGRAHALRIGKNGIVVQDGSPL
jgi:circadian clock protein KaiC